MLFIYCLGHHIYNQYELKKTDEKIFNTSLDEARKLDEITRVKKIHAYVKSHIGFEGLDVNMDRPILRASEIETLKSGKGFCGENVRVMIKLLDQVGIPARRFYLYGEQWQHVLTECKIDGKWYLIDAHNDPFIEMTGDMIGKIPSPDFKLLKNTDETNEWLDYHRIRFFEFNSFLKNKKKIYLPHSVVYFFESIFLIKAAVIAGLFIGVYFIEKKFAKISVTVHK
ncbi:MAG: transglutaminase domain-containing protein [Bacteroidetes bacterium]|nr:transglutaminase domain-containing protein [Bacteroidota bacterium]